MAVGELCRRGAVVSLSLGLLGSILAFFPTTMLPAERFALPQEMVLHLAALVSALLALLAANSGPQMDEIDLGAGLFVLLGLVSAFSTPNPWLAWRSLGLSASTVLLFWVARGVAWGKHRRTVLWIAALAVGAAAAVALLEAYGALDGLSPPGRRPGGTIGNRNRLAHLLVLALPVVWWGIARTRQRVQLWVLLGCAAASSAVVVLSRSRGAWLALGALGIFGVGAYLAGRGNAAISGGRMAAFIAVVALSGLAAVIVPNRLAWRSDDAYADTFRRLTDYREGTGRGRLVQYLNTLRMVRDSPMLGVGPGNWMIYYPRYASPGDPSFEPRASVPVNRLPHGDWIGFAAERGLPALVLLGATGGLLVLRSWRKSRQRQSRTAQTSALVVAGTLLVLLVVGTFDPALQTPAVACWISVTVGVLTPRPSAALRLGRRGGLLLTTGMLAISTVAAYHTTLRIWAGSHYATRPTLERLERAVQIYPGDYDAHLRLQVYWSRRGECEQARPHFRAAQRLYPTAWLPHFLWQRCQPATRPSHSEASARGAGSASPHSAAP